ncbi:MAG: hypothetical protein OXC68_12685 [Aestuariivita sp.]|nr:hypothetical protein [Aestuariivita sp.]
MRTSHHAMERSLRESWPVSQKHRSDDYFKAKFYGQRVQEVNGMFERYGVVGAFGTQHEYLGNCALKS